MSWESTINYFENFTTLQKLVWLLGCMILFWALEYVVPFYQKKYKKWHHARTNMALLAVILCLNVLIGIVLGGVFVWMDSMDFGLFRLMKLPIWAVVFLSIIVLDFFAQYMVHYLEHKVSFMWRFHMVHHSDKHVDVTTGTRHHPINYLFREAFALLAIILFGIPLVAYMIYRLATILFTYFTHADINIPDSMDKMISLVFVSPNMHKFHHHFERPWTDTNFGNMFSIWDRIFGTFAYGDKMQIKYGLDVITRDTSDDLGYQLKLPFDKSIPTDY